MTTKSEIKRDRYYLKIGGFRFAISSKFPNLLTHDEPVYRSFICTGGDDAADITVQIDLEKGEISAPGDMKEIFTSDLSWSMYRSGDEYMMVRRPPVFPQAIWAARFDRDVKKVTVYCGDKVTSSPFRYPLDQVLLMYGLAQHEGAIVHAAGIEIAGRGYIFPGASGAGKSTLARQFMQQEGSRRSVLSDDRMIVRQVGGNFRAYGTPWPGEEGAALNRSMSLSAILFLAHGERNKISEIDKKEALERVLPVTSIPWYDSQVMEKVLHFGEEMLANIPCYEIQFVPDAQVIAFLEELSL